jgi:hypothetical protein
LGVQNNKKNKLRFDFLPTVQYKEILKKEGVNNATGKAKIFR